MNARMIKSFNERLGGQIINKDKYRYSGIGSVG
jgi:hypothetical protein